MIHKALARSVVALSLGAWLTSCTQDSGVNFNEATPQDEEALASADKDQASADGTAEGGGYDDNGVCIQDCDAVAENGGSGGSANGGGGSGGNGSGGSGGENGGGSGDEQNPSTPPQYSGASEMFVQESANSKKLDILLVVDNSGSMIEEQTNLATKLSPILSAVGSADWKVGVTSTDGTENGCLREMISKTGDARTAMEKEIAFASAITGLGIKGSGNEQGIPMAVKGLQGCGGSNPWVRNDSYVAVLIVSDEDNCSNGQGCTPSALNSADHLLNYLTNNAQRTLGDTAKIYSIHRRNAGECPQAANIGNVYNAAVAASGGISGAICDADYSNTLNAMSLDLSVTLDLNFTLAHTPKPGSVKVFVNDVEVTSGFTVSGNIVIFDQASAPAAGALVLIQYDYQTN